VNGADPTFKNTNKSQWYGHIGQLYPTKYGQDWPVGPPWADDGFQTDTHPMLIYYGDGRVLTGILLSLKGNQMRVAVKDADDVVEYRLAHGLWISEDGEPVTFDFPTAIFDAVGIVLDESCMNSQPETVWHESTSGTAVDRPN
jgi:hypothetical protein